MKTATINTVKMINGELKCIDIKYRYESIPDALQFICELMYGKQNQVIAQINTIKI